MLPMNLPPIRSVPRVQHPKEPVALHEPPAEGEGREPCGSLGLRASSVRFLPRKLLHLSMPRHPLQLQVAPTAAARSWLDREVQHGRLTLLLAVGMVGLAVAQGFAAVTVNLQEVERLRAQEAHFDATLWEPEIQALEYERPWLELRDRVIQATNRIEALATFEFDELQLPTPRPDVIRYANGIVRQQFDTSNLTTLPSSVWRSTLRSLEAKGWTLRQVEWSHERFLPPREGSPAQSTLRFELHGERRTLSSRFILAGELQVIWNPQTILEARLRPKTIRVGPLEVLERSGPPGFSRDAVVTPQPPEMRGVMRNMHPVLVLDLNGDSRDDIVMSGINQVLLSRGTNGWTPQEWLSDSVYAGANSAGVIADFDGDGLPDFLTVGNRGSLRDQLTLYGAKGGVPFAAAPVAACPGLVVPAPGVITAGDVEADGDLDVWLGQYKPPYVGGQMPTPYYDANDGHAGALLLNNGRGQFRPGTAAAGLSAKSRRRTYAASLVDLDDDLDLDLVTLNDFAGVDLYLNDGTGKFTDLTDRLYNRHLFGMSHCFGDFDQDGRLDLYAVGMRLPTVRRLEALGLRREDKADRTRKRVDMAYGSRLYVQRPEGWMQPPFADALAATGWSWGVSAQDFDNDGDLDLYLANGHVSGRSCEDRCSFYWRHDIYLGTSRNDPTVWGFFDKPFRGLNSLQTSWNGHQHNTFFMDGGDNQYLSIGFLMGIAHETDCRAVVGADLNNDGRPDLIVTESESIGDLSTGRHRLLVHLNQLPNSGHWIGVRLPHRKHGVSPIGAKVMVRTSTRTYTRQIVTGDSFQAQHPPTAHFGLGSEQEVEEVVVRWPNGRVERVPSPTVDRYHSL